MVEKLNEICAILTIAISLQTQLEKNKASILSASTIGEAAAFLAWFQKADMALLFSILSYWSAVHLQVLQFKLLFAKENVQKSPTSAVKRGTYWSFNH